MEDTYSAYPKATGSLLRLRGRFACGPSPQTVAGKSEETTRVVWLFGQTTALPPTLLTRLSTLA